MHSVVAAGYKAIFLSVDTPVLGRRLNEHRNNFLLPDDMSWPNLLSDGRKELSNSVDEKADSNPHAFGPSRPDFWHENAKMTDFLGLQIQR